MTTKAVHPLISFNKSFLAFWIFLTGLPVLVNSQWPAFKELLMRNGFLSFTQDGLFIINPLAENIWYILSMALVTFGIALYLIYKDLRAYGNGLNSWAMLLCWLTLIFLFLHMLASPTAWYGVIAIMYLLYFFVWVLVKVVAGCMNF